MGDPRDADPTQQPLLGGPSIDRECQRTGSTDRDPTAQPLLGGVPSISECTFPSSDIADCAKQLLLGGSPRAATNQCPISKNSTEQYLLCEFPRQSKSDDNDSTQELVLDHDRSPNDPELPSSDSDYTTYAIQPSLGGSTESSECPSADSGDTDTATDSPDGFPGNSVLSSLNADKYYTTKQTLQCGLPSDSKCPTPSSDDIDTTKQLLPVDSPSGKGRSFAGRDYQVLGAAPDGGWGWVIVFAVFMSTFLVDGCIGSFGIIYPELLRSFKAGPAVTSLAGSIIVAVFLMSCPVGGYLLRRFGCRLVCIVGGCMTAVGFLVSSLAADIVIFIVTYGVLGGIGIGMNSISGNVLVNMYFDKRRGLACGIVSSGAGFGVFVMALLTQKLIDHYGWRGTMLITAGIMLHFCVFACFLRPVKPLQYTSLTTGSNSDSSDGVSSDEISSSESSGSNSPVKVVPRSAGICDLTVFKSGVYVPILLGAILLQMGQFIPSTFIPEYCVKIGLSGDDGSIIISIHGAVNILGRLSAGCLANTRCVSSLWLCNFGAAMCAVCCFMFPLCTSFSSLCVFAVGFGYFIGYSCPLQYIIIVEYLGLNKLTSAMGILQMCKGPAALVGPPLAGFVYEWTQDYAMTVEFAAGLFLVATIIQSTVPLTNRCCVPAPATQDRMEIRVHV